MKNKLLMAIAGKILGSDKYPLNSLGEFNTRLKIITYGERSGQKMYQKIVEISGDDNNKLRELNNKTRYLLDGKILNAESKGKILEKLGYEVI